MLRQIIQSTVHILRQTIQSTVHMLRQIIQSTHLLFDYSTATALLAPHIRLTASSSPLPSGFPTKTLYLVFPQACHIMLSQAQFLPHDLGQSPLGRFTQTHNTRTIRVSYIFIFTRYSKHYSNFSALNCNAKAALICYRHYTISTVRDETGRGCLELRETRAARVMTMLSAFIVRVHYSTCTDHTAIH
jgi:hypothetical protein